MVCDAFDVLTSYVSNAVMLRLPPDESWKTDGITDRHAGAVHRKYALRMRTENG